MQPRPGTSSEQFPSCVVAGVFGELALEEEVAESVSRTKRGPVEVIGPEPEPNKERELPANTPIELLVEEATAGRAAPSKNNRINCHGEKFSPMKGSCGARIPDSSGDKEYAEVDCLVLRALCGQGALSFDRDSS